MIIVFYLALYCICSRAAVEEANSRRFISIVLIPDPGENKPEDDLPPYTPPTPKTQAAMTDLPPSYEETLDISEVRIPIHNVNNNNNSNAIENVNANNNETHNNNIPTTCVAPPNTINNNVNIPTTNVNSNINTIPEIVIDPTNTPNTTVS